MDSFIRQKLDNSISERKKYHNPLLNNCATYPPFLQLEQNAFAPGALDKKTKELMALSISIVTKCEPCIEWHTAQALLSGATDPEVYETIDVAIEMGGGPAAAYARYALHSLEYHRENRK